MPREIKNNEYRVAITPAGSAILESGIAIWDQVQGEVVAELGARRWTQLITGLQTITAMRTAA